MDDRILLRRIKLNIVDIVKLNTNNVNDWRMIDEAKKFSMTEEDMTH